MATLQITQEMVRIANVLTTPAIFYQVRPNAPTLPEGAVVLWHNPGVVTYVSDGETQEAFMGDIPALTALIEESGAIAADIAAL